MLECDVLVIGAGPAGCVAAMTAAREGADVIILERKKVVGQPVQCAEHIPHQVVREFNIDDSIIAQEVRAMRTHLPDGEIVETPMGGVICHRDRFDLFLAKLAETAGARLFTGTSASSLIDGVVTTAAAGSSRDGVVTTAAADSSSQIRAKVIVGADGPASRIREWLGLAKNRFVQAKQHQLTLSKNIDTTEIYFRKGIPGGYGWLFPKGRTANVGVGVDPGLGVTAGQALDELTAELAGQRPG